MPEKPLRSRYERQRVIERGTPRQLQPDASGQITAPAASAGSGTPCKVVAVNRVKRVVHVARVVKAFDASDPTQWGNSGNFDTDHPVCAWPMSAFPVCDVGWAGILHETPYGNWVQVQLNLHPIAEDETDHQFGTPEGSKAPDLVIDSASNPLDRPAICTETYACCLPDQTCENLNAIDCASAGGVFYGPGTGSNYGGDTGKQCTGDDVNCAAVNACVDFGDQNFSCINVESREECNALGGTYAFFPCPCDDWNTTNPFACP